MSTEVHGAAENAVAGVDANPVGVVVEGALVGIYHVNIQVAVTWACAIPEEVDASNGTGIAQFRRGVNLL